MEVVNQIFDLQNVLKDCSEFVNVLKTSERGCFLIRGCYKYDIDIKKYSYSIVNRKPRKTPIDIHNAINDHFLIKHNWPIRNGLFCYGVKQNFHKLSDNSYGKPYLFFPCNGFSYVYDKNIFDLTGYYYEFIGDDIEFLESLNYESDNLPKIMAYVVDEDRSVEISVNCKDYYLVNLSFLDELSKLIWP